MEQTRFGGDFGEEERLGLGNLELDLMRRGTADAVGLGW